MRFNTRLAVGIGMLILLILLVGGYPIYRSNSLAGLIDRFYRHPFAVSNGVRDIRAGIIAMHRSMKDVAMAEDEAQMTDALKEVASTEQVVLRHFDLVSDRFLGDKTEVERFRKEFVDWHNIRSEVVYDMRRGARKHATAVTRGKGAKHVALLNRHADALVFFASEKGKEFHSMAGEEHARALVVMGILLSISILTSCAVAHYLTHNVAKRMQAEDRLGEAEKLNQAMLDHSPVCHKIVDLDFNLRYMNASGIKALKIEDTAQIYGKPYPFDFYPEASRKQMTQNLEKVRDLGEIITQEAPVVDVDGNELWFQSTLAPIFDDGGKLDCIVIVSSDTTERMRYEEALRDSEERFRTAFESAEDCILIWDKDYNYLYANQAAIDHVGTTRDKIVGKNIRDGLSHIPDFMHLWMSRVDSVFAENSDFRYQDQTKLEGREYFTESVITPIRSPDGRVSAVCVVYRDITERKRAEEGLQVSEASYRTIFNSGYDAIFIHDIATGTILDVNMRMCEMYGYTHDEALNLTVADISLGELSYTEEDAATWIHKAVTQGPQTFEWIGKKKSGEQLWVEVTLQQVLIVGNERVLATARDIGARKRAEEENEKLKNQLLQGQKMEAIGRLAGGVAHDFNNMLGVILGHTDMLLLQLDSSHPCRADLEEIQKAGERSADLIQQLLAFARKQTVAPKVLNLNTTVSEMSGMLHRLIGEDIDLVWKPGEQIWPVKVDPGQIDQILANLCVNARDAIADVGKITIETDNAVFDEDYCSVYAGFSPGEYVLLAVSDSGCGMAPETVAQLFEPFFTTKDSSKGTGLGLATVYGIVKQNKGFVNVYSELDQGTTFKIYLPRHAGKLERARSGNSPESFLRGHETILLVEDEPAILNMTARMLESLGYLVLTAGTPGDAIRLVGEHVGDIHLLMTDVVMPEMNGRDLAKNLLSRCPNLRCLFMSGYTANVIAHHGVLDEGVNFIQKPFPRKGLSIKLREVLDNEGKD